MGSTARSTALRAAPVPVDDAWLDSTMHRTWMNRITFALLWIMIFTIPFHEILVIPGFGSFTRMLGYATLAGALIVIMERGRVETLLGPAPWAFLFVIWAALSILWTLWPELTYERLPTFIRCLGLYWIIYEIVDTKTRASKLMFGYVLGAYVCCAGILRSLGAEQALEDAEYTRYAFGFSDPNDLATGLAVAIPMAWYLSTRGESRIYVWISRLYVPVAVVAVLLTGSRGGFLAMIVSLLMVAWTFRKLELRFKVLAVVVLLLILAGTHAIVPGSALSRLATIPEEIAAGTLSQRADIWRGGFSLLKQNVLLGVGSGAFSYELFAHGGYVHPRVPHSTMLGVLFELGVVGFFLFVALIVTTFAAVRRLPLHERKMCQIVLVTWLVGGASLSWEYQKVTWWLLGVIAAMALRTPLLGRQGLAMEGSRAP